MERYHHQEIEKKWQEKWRAQKLYDVHDTADGKENYYQLVEFPYPSGNLHVGHWYAFCGPDIHARYMRMRGYNVLFPIGFDAFGLPAENAAIKRNLNPADWTEDNMAHMRAQIDSMGTSFDRSREIATCRPDYYKHTQWLFTQLFRAGLVERKTTEANWCPSCKTVLANEQVVADACERCDTPVEKKQMPQWQIKITRYADRLIDDLDTLDWPEEIKAAQRNWIGRSEGAEIDFVVQGRDEKITVFTTRPDTLFGATYVVMAPEHERVRVWLADGVITNAQEVEEYIVTTQKKSDIERTAEGKEKTGVRLEGVTVTNPANGEELPVFIADYVLAHYGTGAIMAVPAHDQRDFDFARKYDLPIVDVVSPSITISFEYSFALIESKIQKKLESYGIIWNANNVHSVPSLTADKARNVDDLISDRLGVSRIFESDYCDVHILENYHSYTGDGILINSGAFNGMTSAEAKRAITEAVGGRMTTTYKLRDWGVSRQRYWGCPIPLVHCEKCDWQIVPEEHLPVVLPDVADYLPNDDGRSPLAKNADFVHTVCPRCGGDAERETDTMDTFVDSSWYFLRYTDPHNSARFADVDKLAQWLPVDFYSGGAEHTTMHLLYSRFFHKALYDMELVGESEPYVKRRNRGLIMGPDGNKMSKSKGNVIDPDDIVEKLGADTLRLYLAFIGPYNEVGNYPWNPQSIIGVRRFVERVWRLQEKCHCEEQGGTMNDGAISDNVRVADKALHKALAHVTQSIEDFKLNTGVAALMQCVNTLEKADALTPAQLALFAQMLAPYAPHIAEELWRTAGGDDSVHTSTWPQVDAALLTEDTMTLAVQINGKVRAEITMPADADEATVTQTALSHERIQKHLDGAAPKKTIYVKGRLVNIVA